MRPKRAEPAVPAVARGAQERREPAGPRGRAEPGIMGLPAPAGLRRAAGRAVLPERAEPAVLPERLEPAVSPEAVARALSPEAVARTVSPEAVARTVSPEAVARTVSPEAVARTVSPGSGGAAGAGTGGTVNPGDSVLMHHKNLSRDGVYVQPPLTKAAAAGLHTGPDVPSAVLGPVLRAAAVRRRRRARPDLVIVATEANNVYALDAASGAQVWMTNLGVAGAAGQACRAGTSIPSASPARRSSTSRRARSSSTR